MRKKIVAGNWKMNNNLSDGVQLSLEVNKFLNDNPNDVEVILGVPFIHLQSVNEIENKKINVAAQDCSTHQSGAYTGEISASMIESTGANYVIIGHSERRMYHNESNNDLAKKVNSALSNGLKVIFCCGESLPERESKSYFNLIERQLEESLFHLSEKQMEDVVIAYEPIWAIGTGVTASSEQAQEMHKFIRKLIETKYNQNTADQTSILYGGSCKPTNANDLFSKEDVDGGLIGGASLKASDFSQIITSF
ncbi:MAG: triose-phosphate isomerase [Flavobacteriales bacterium]